MTPKEEILDLKRQVSTLTAALQAIKVDCFDDSDWAKIIDAALANITDKPEEGK